MVHNDNKKYDLKVLVLTVSSTRSIENDETGRKLESLFKNDGYAVSRKICTDDESEILKLIFCNYENDIFVINGGTGASRKDVTVRAIEKIAEKEIRGFGELFRERSGGILPYISNASLFIRGKKELFCIPGSPDAAEIAYKVIGGMMNHLYTELNKES
ncbi:MAG: molybdopterin-binding protein [Thermoplasmata archaeon]